MATLNLSSNGPSIKSSYQGVINSPAPSGPAASSATYGQWAIFSVSAPLVSAFQLDSGGKESVLKVQSTGEGELVDLIDEFSEGRIQFAFVRVKDPNTTLPKYVLIGWCGEGVPERTKGYFTSHLAAVSKVLHGYHVQITARSDRDLTPDGIVQKVADASGSKYSGAITPTPTPGPTPPVSSKPAFLPTQSGGNSGFNPLRSSRLRQSASDGGVDEDGWGVDAPQVTRTQLEKVQPAYQPTKVNMAELKQKREIPRDVNNLPENARDNSDIIKGGYQPVGKVDIAALRAQAQKSTDDRPTIVKGAYEPVGKVDIAAIRAKAQKPYDDGLRHPPLSATVASADNGTDGEPKSVAARSAAFSQSERLTSLPKPKLANKFGSSTNNFTGTKAPTPGLFGLQSALPAAASAPVGAASRTFADEGGKTPAQVWAEKKARERGLSGAGETKSSSVLSPITSQTSGGGEWKSGYTGKTWAPVATTTTGRSGTSSIGEQRTGEQDREEQDVPISPSGGISALRDKFQGAPPMGAPTIARGTTRDPSPPPQATASKPPRGVAMPGLPAYSRPVQDDREQDSDPNIPPPPRLQRSPSPQAPVEREESPVRIARPVARGRVPEAEVPEEEQLLPPAIPIRPVEENIADEEDLTEEPAEHDPSREAGIVMAEASSGQVNVPSTNETFQGSGRSAVVQYDYEKAEDNEIELIEGEIITDIDLLDPDWYAGTNSKGERGLFPANYVELLEEEKLAPHQPARHKEVEEEEEESAPHQPARHTEAPPSSTKAKPTATALYDYEAAEDNEISFAEGDQITDLEFPDEAWWAGHCNGQSGLFPSNYVQLDE